MGRGESGSGEAAGASARAASSNPAAAAAPAGIRKRRRRFKALSNTEIEKAGRMLGVPFRGRVMWDPPDLARQLPKIAASPTPYFIWNDSPKGTHWTGVLIDKEGGTAYVFNSMGLPLDQPVVDALYDELGIRSFVSNDAPIQASDSASCGYWAVYFLYKAQQQLGKNKEVQTRGAYRKTYRDLIDRLSTDDYESNEDFIEGWWRARNLPVSSSSSSI